jgi:hypothetical protein
MILSVDIGLRGGLVTLDEGGTIIRADDMPTIREEGIAKGKRREIIDTHSLFNNYKGYSHIIIEEQLALPNQKYIDRIFFNYGATLTALQLTNPEAKIIKVHPSKWTSAFNLKGKSKKFHIGLANTYAQNYLFAKDGVADAFLIGLYAIRLGLIK